MLRSSGYILISAIFVSSVSCSSEEGELTEEQLEVAEMLSEKFGDKTELVYGGDTLLTSKDILAYYETRDFAPVWIATDSLTADGREMLSLVKNSTDFGLLPEMFNYRLIKTMQDSSLLDTEMLLSNAFFLMISHVDKGCVDTGNFEYVWKKDALDYEISAELQRVFDGESPRKVIEEKQPAHWEYKQLQTGLATFLNESKLDTNHYEIPKFKDDSVICYKAAREALFGHGFLDSAGLKDDSLFLQTLREFQILCGLKDDAIVGKWTGFSLSKSNTDRFLQAALSLEKWRWKPDTMPSKYIRVNIPEFHLYFVDNDTLKRKHRVIVGAQATPTPQIKAIMERMVTNPIWHVPYSISTTEIVAGAKKDTAYFRKRGYQVFQNGEEKNAAEIDWTNYKQGNFPFKIQQRSGAGNSLGRLKFLFPNSDMVYIHDTPTKYLFTNDVRAYSHGCVRLENPIDLGREILRTEINKMAADTLDSVIYRGQNRVVEFTEPFPVYLEYFTASGDSSGNVIFHPDIYGRDEKFIRNSFRKFVR